MKLTAVLWAVIVLAAMAGAALTLVARGNLARGDLASNLALSVSVAAFATLGALIVRRAGNRIGWIMLAAGAAQAFLAIASVYAVIGLATFPGALPAAKDDGTGFDTATTRPGTGLQGMADRLAALGGALHVRSRPGEGTTLSGELPVSALG